MASGNQDWVGDINFARQIVGVFLQPEYAANTGVDKNFSGIVRNAAWGAFLVVQYNVPAGKTLYVNQMAFASIANLAADADKNQMTWGWIYDTTAGVLIWSQGANGGGGLNFPKPLVFPAGTTVQFYCFNQANHASDLYVTVGGYQLG